MLSKPTLSARVAALAKDGSDVLRIELEHPEGLPLPAFTPGSHINVHLPNGHIRAYSLAGDDLRQDRYLLGVLREPKSRGGSQFVHETLRVGDVIEISEPRNAFELQESQSRSLLIAGGIGITPILSMFRHLRRNGKPVDLLYCARSRTQAGFIADIEAIAPDASFHFDDENGGRPASLAGYLRQAGGDDLANVHAYCCGPGPMLNAFEAACAEVGIGHAHTERFVAAAPSEDSYSVTLASSKRVIEVKKGTSLLDALLAAGVPVDSDCRNGICGTCETRVLAGEIEHRDSVLSPKERERNDVMMVCVSGCLSDNLELDL